MQSVSHTLRKNRWRPQRQVIALATLGVFVVIIIGTLYLSQASQMSTMGRELSDLIVTRNNLEQVNEQLRAEIAGLQGMGRLQARAQELGFAFADRSDIEYLVVEGYNPNRGEEVVPVRDAAPTVVPQYEESLLGWVQQQIDTFTDQANTP
ncbi:MAG: hypothetical protein SF162_18460 [bacterium]|nr:hypothetical protein [bacterium]